MKKEIAIKKVNLTVDSWIDVNNNRFMTSIGFRPVVQSKRDESVWTKTPYEKRMLKKLRHTYKNKDMHFHSRPLKTFKLYDKLIVYLYKNKQFNKTTYSIKCWQHEIPNILAKFKVVNNKTDSYKNIVMKYVWNGKTYGPKDLPFSK